MIMTAVKCNDCNISFRDHFNLSQHFRTRKHSAPTKTVACSLCRHSFQSVYTLRRHWNTLHSNRDGVSRKSDVQCPLCSTSMYKLLIYEHFQDDHSIELEYKKRKFGSLGLFESWKSNYERETVARYVLYSTNRLVDGSIKRTYNCQRSGKPKIKPSEMRVHKLRQKGSAKVNGFCPARIVMCLNRNSNEVTAEVCTTHIGHTNDLGSVDLRFEDRAFLASLIAEGVSFDEILERVRDTMTPSNLDRIHLTTRKDLHNIAKEFKLTKRDSMKRIADDTGISFIGDNYDSLQSDDTMRPNLSKWGPSSATTEDPTLLNGLPGCTIQFEARPMSSTHDFVACPIYDQEPGDEASSQGIDCHVKEIVLSASGSNITGQADEPQRIPLNLEGKIEVIEDDGVVFIVKSDANNAVDW